MRKNTLAAILILIVISVSACTSNTGTGNVAEAGKGSATSPASGADGVNKSENAEKADEAGNGANKADSAQRNAEDPAKKPEKKPEEKPTEKSDSAKRIKFPKGATEVTVTGNLEGFEDSQTYLIELRADQTFKAENVGENYVTLSVSDPTGKNADDYDLSCHGNFNISKTIKGDYKILVTECKKADPWKGKFKLKVTAVNN